MAENEQIGVPGHIDTIRRELDGKIEKKVSEVTFWSAIAIIVGAVGGMYFWLMNVNERMTRAETKIELMQPPTSKLSK